MHVRGQLSGIGPAPFAQGAIRVTRESDHPVGAGGPIGRSSVANQSVRLRASLPESASPLLKSIRSETG